MAWRLSGPLLIMIPQLQHELFRVASAYPEVALMRKLVSDRRRSGARPGRCLGALSACDAWPPSTAVASRPGTGAEATRPEAVPTSRPSGGTARPGEETNGQRRLALIVGVGQYKNSRVPDLADSPDDAARCYALLTGLLAVPRIFPGARDRTWEAGRHGARTCPHPEEGVPKHRTQHGENRCALRVAPCGPLASMWRRRSDETAHSGRACYG
jgi:hypothetical protein